MNRRIMATAVSLLLIFTLCGCGNGSTTEEYEGSNTAEIKKDGAITSTIQDSFLTQQYDEELLEEFTLKEAAEYNHENGEGAISIKKLEVKNDKVTLVMEYQTAEDFENFNQYPFFSGTVEEAFAAGYDFNGVDFYEAGTASEKEDQEEKASIQAEKLKEMGSRRIVIAQPPEEERLKVKTSGKILYISGAEYEKKNLAVIEGGADVPAYIVFK